MATQGDGFVDCTVYTTSCEGEPTKITTAIERNKLIHSLNPSSKFYTYRRKKDFHLHNSLLLPFILPTAQFPNFFFSKL